MHINPEQNSGPSSLYPNLTGAELRVVLETGRPLDMPTFQEGILNNFRHAFEDYATTIKPPEVDKRKSFNELSYVNMMRHDLEKHGYVKPNTKEQVRNEFLTHICEGIDQASKTDFVLHNDADGLKYFKNGEWTPYASMLDSGL